VKSEGVIDGDTGDEGCHDVKHWTRRVFSMRMMERNRKLIPETCCVGDVKHCKIQSMRVVCHAVMKM